MAFIQKNLNSIFGMRGLSQFYFKLDVYSSQGVKIFEKIYFNSPILKFDILEIICNFLLDDTSHTMKNPSENQPYDMNENFKIKIIRRNLSLFCLMSTALCIWLLFMCCWKFITYYDGFFTKYSWFAIIKVKIIYGVIISKKFL